MASALPPLVTDFRRSSFGIEAADSWEGLAQADEPLDRWETWTGLRISIGQLEARLDGLAVEYDEATAVLQKTQARVERMERKYKPQEATSPVHIARRYFKKQWRYDECIAETKRQIDELAAKLLRLG